jgi:copper chaperone
MPSSAEVRAPALFGGAKIPEGGILATSTYANGEALLRDTITYTVPAMHCGHCEAAVTSELGAVEGVDAVVVDLDSKRVTVTGNGLDDAALRAAIEEAGYEAA